MTDERRLASHGYRRHRTDVRNLATSECLFMAQLILRTPSGAADLEDGGGELLRSSRGAPPQRTALKILAKTQRCRTEAGRSFLLVYA